jgi:hypothetical protein
MGFIWFIYGNYVLINYQDCRLEAPALFYLVLANVLITYMVFVAPFLVFLDILTFPKIVLCVVVLCSNRIMARSEALAMAASAAGFSSTSYGLTPKELTTLKVVPFEATVDASRPHSDSADTSVCAICFSDYGSFSIHLTFRGWR